MTDMKKEAKIYQMNECDWWADYSLEEAKNNYLKFTGMTEKDNYWEDEPPAEIDQENMDRLRFTTDEPNVIVRSFAEELTKRIENNEIPGFFASTEY